MQRGISGCFAASSLSHPLRPRCQRCHPVAQPQVDEHCLVGHDLHGLPRRFIPRMTWSEAGTVEVCGDRCSGVGPEGERFGELAAHVDQVFPERVLHPVGPSMRRGVVFQLGDDDVRITSAGVTRTVVREHRTASLMGCAVPPRLQRPVQLLVPGRVRLGVHQQADVAM